MPFARSHIFLALLALLLGLSAFFTTFKSDIDSFFKPADTTQQAVLAVQMQSGVLSRRYLLAIGGQTQRPSAAFMQSLVIELQGISGIAAVWNAEEKRGALETIETIYAPHAATMYSRQPEADLHRLFSANGLAQRAAFLKNALLSPHSDSVKKIAAQDNLLLSINSLLENPHAFLPAAPSTSTYQHLIVETKISGLEAAAQTQIQQQMQSVFSVQKQRFTENVTLEMTGVPVFASAVQTRMQHEIAVISIVSTLVLGGLFLGLFKSLRLLGWVAALLLGAVCSAVLVTQLVFGFVHTLTLALGTTLLGICVDYPLHALAHSQYNDKNQSVSVIKKIWTSMILGGATTLIGYFALGLSGYPGFEQIAVYAGTGIAVALLLTRFVLPEVIRADQPALRLAPALAWLSFTQRQRGFLWTVLAVAGVVSVLALPSLHELQDLQQLTPEMNALKIADARLRARLVSVEPGRFLLVSGDTSEQTLQRLEQIYPQLDAFQAQGDLQGYFGLSPWLLSQRQQHENAQRLRAMLTADIRQRWHDSLTAQGLSTAELGQLNYVEKQELTPEQVLATPIGRWLDAQWLPQSSQTLAIIWLAEHRPAALQKIVKNQTFVQYISQRDWLNAQAANYQHKAQTLLLLGLLLILALLTWRYQNLWQAVEVVAPAVLAAVFVLAGCAVAGVAISFLHLVGLLLVVSIGVDYGIFYHENRGGNLPVTYQAMLASMLTSSLAFACLGLADTTVLQILAYVVSSGIIVSFLLCPILISKTTLSD